MQDSNPRFSLLFSFFLVRLPGQPDQTKHWVGHGLAFCGRTCPPQASFAAPYCRNEWFDSLKFQGSNEPSLFLCCYGFTTHTYCTLKLSKLQNRTSASRYPTPLNEKKKKPHLSQTQQINHHSPSHPQHTVSSNLPRHQSIKTPIPKKEAPPQRNPRVPIKLPKQLFSSYLYLPCKPTKTKTPSKGPGKIAARMHMYVWYGTVVYVLFR